MLESVLNSDHAHGIRWVLIQVDPKQSPVARPFTLGLIKRTALYVPMVTLVHRMFKRIQDKLDIYVCYTHNIFKVAIVHIAMILFFFFNFKHTL